MAVLARVLVTAEHVLARVSEAEPLPLLILETRDPGIPDELEVRGSRFDDASCDRQKFQHILTQCGTCARQGCFRPRGKPSPVLAVNPIVEAWRASASCDGAFPDDSAVLWTKARSRPRESRFRAPASPPFANPSILQPQPTTGAGAFFFGTRGRAEDLKKSCFGRNFWFMQTRCAPVCLSCRGCRPSREDRVPPPDAVSFGGMCTRLRGRTGEGQRKGVRPVSFSAFFSGCLDRGRQDRVLLPPGATPGVFLWMSSFGVFPSLFSLCVPLCFSPVPAFREQAGEASVWEQVHGHRIRDAGRSELWAESALLPKVPAQAWPCAVPCPWSTLRFSLFSERALRPFCSSGPFWS